MTTKPRDWNNFFEAEDFIGTTIHGSPRQKSDAEYLARTANAAIAQDKAEYDRETTYLKRQETELTERIGRTFLEKIRLIQERDTLKARLWEAERVIEFVVHGPIDAPWEAVKIRNHCRAYLAKYKKEAL